MNFSKNFFSKSFFTRSDYYLGSLLLSCLIPLILYLIGFYLHLGLLYGPLLYLFIKPRKFKTFLLHCLPFLLYHVGNLGEIRSEYYFILGFSFSIYSMLSLIALHASTESLSKQKLGYQLSFLYLLCSILVIVVGWKEEFSLDVGFDPEYLIFGIFTFSSLIIYFHFENHLKISVLKETEPTVPEEVKLEMRSNSTALELEKIKSLKEDIFLTSNLTLGKLSKELDIPKHRLSQCLKVYFGTTFYEYVAYRRIEFAIKQIQLTNSRTLESLAYECGFNSKTSFNKYFKKYTGIRPSEYRQNLARQVT